GRLLDLKFRFLEGGRAVAGLLHHHVVRHGGLAAAGDLAHDHLGEVLAMTLGLAVALAALFLEHADLVAAVVLENLELDHRALDRGRADRDGGAVGVEEYVGNREHLAHGGAEPGKLDPSPGGDLVLEAAGSNHRIHGNTLVEKQGWKVINPGPEFKGNPRFLSKFRFPSCPGRTGSGTSRGTGSPISAGNRAYPPRGGRFSGR